MFAAEEFANRMKIYAEAFQEFGETVSKLCEKLADFFKALNERFSERKPAPYIDRSLVLDTRRNSQVLLNKPRFIVRKII